MEMVNTEVMEQATANIQEAVADEVKNEKDPKRFLWYAGAAAGLGAIALGVRKLVKKIKEKNEVTETIDLTKQENSENGEQTGTTEDEAEALEQTEN